MIARGVALLLLACIVAICFAAVSIAALAMLPAAQAVSLIESVGHGLAVTVVALAILYGAARVLS